MHVSELYGSRQSCGASCEEVRSGGGGDRRGEGEEGRGRSRGEEGRGGEGRGRDGDGTYRVEEAIGKVVPF